MEDVDRLADDSDIDDKLEEVDTDDIDEGSEADEDEVEVDLDDIVETEEIADDTELGDPGTTTCSNCCSGLPPGTSPISAAGNSTPVRGSSSE
jgi:hypothetical protein